MLIKLVGGKFNNVIRNVEFLSKIIQIPVQDEKGKITHIRYIKSDEVENDCVIYILEH